MLLSNTKSSYKEFIILLFFVFVVTLFAFNILNAEEVNSKPELTDNSNNKEAVQKVPTTKQGLKVYIDPDTGELISQPEEESLTVQPNNSVLGGADVVVEQPQEIIHPDGSATVIMPDSMQHSTKITIDENGKQTTECNRKHEHTHE